MSPDNKPSISGLLKSTSLPALYAKIALLAIAFYFIAGFFVPNPPFTQFSYNTIQNASAMAAAMGTDNDATYDAAYKQGYLRTDFANITVPGHALPVLELSILLAFFLLWPAPLLARLALCAAALPGMYFLNSLRLAVLLHMDHFYPAYFPWMNQYFVPLGYVCAIMFFLLLYILVFGRFNRQ